MVFCDTTGHHRPFTKQSFRRRTGLQQCVPGQVQTSLLPEYLPRYTAYQRRRHEVKPGISGWAQVNGRNAIGWDKKFELDVYYVNNQSFLLDLKIMMLTIKKILFTEGINQQGRATMEPFKGSES